MSIVIRAHDSVRCLMAFVRKGRFDALYMAFDEEKEPTGLEGAQVLTGFVPLSKLMAEQITGLRNWSKGRARLATTQKPETKLRRLG